MILPLVLALLAQVVDSTGAARRVDGTISRGLRTGQEALVGQWVVLHRLGPERSGPIDSTRTGPNGAYSFRYRATGDTAAIYFVTTSYGGIVYPTAPFRSERVSGDAAMIVVFDTSSAPASVKLGGRHVIVGAQQPNGRRPIGEVYDLENDTTVTFIARDSTTPVYTVHLPPNAENFRLNGNGEIGAGAISRRGTDVGVFAPLSPGIRQFAFTYELPSKAFPLTIPATVPIGVFEVLVEDPTADVRAPGIREVQSTAMEGRTFRRFLAQEVPPSGVVSINVPRIPVADREKVYVGVGVTVLVVMIGALAFAMSRRRRPATVTYVPPVVAEPRSRVLVRTIAELDETFDAAAATESARADYEARRASLKAELADALAAERSGS